MDSPVEHIPQSHSPTVQEIIDRVRNIRVQRGDLFDAERQLLVGLSIHGDQIDLLHELAECYRQRKNRLGVVDVLRRVSNLYHLQGDQPSADSAMVEAASILYVEMGDERTSFTLVNNVLDRKPYHPDACQLAASLYDALGHPDNALMFLKRALTHEHLEPALRHRLLERMAALADTLGNAACAEEAWGKVFELDPTHPIAYGALEEHYSQRREHLPLLQATCRALKALLEGGAAASTEGRVRISKLLQTRARLITYLRRDQNEAQRNLERALLAWPENVEAMEDLANLYRTQISKTTELHALLNRLVTLMVPGPSQDRILNEIAKLEPSVLFAKQL